ncbi:sulfate permease [Massilia sp. PAMC28688]|uniref:SulP family inorganic anion transporter n=1 Tax=Massilia sp. PAMC28688 TaxID=2861283 RepID=UPI001C6390DE|nr:sulfate permease [Massilia sp. PAMC28688]QYF93399.1 sulfate permease [Massilia sp. PAMC28688]
MLHWLRHYRRQMLAGDIGAGIIVAMMVLPQGMAYALVAGLPPVVGLYASIVPPLLYALFGTSMTQSVGPMAITSLMTAAALTPLAQPGTGLYMVLAAQLALMCGVLLLVCGVLRVGFVANFFSRPVMSGFTIGAALLIAWGQVEALLGGSGLQAPHLPSAMLGLGSLIVLLLARTHLAPLLRRLGMAAAAADVGARLAPMLVVVASIIITVLFDLAGAGVRVTGEVPAGLPSLNLALSQAHWKSLVQPALLIGFVIFLVSMSAAQTLALRRQEKLHANFELIGLGAANLGSALTGGMPVTGSISRSAVNFAAGANTPLASIITAGLLAVALVAPTGWLALLPLPTLAATIIVAVLGMLELATLRTSWRFDRSDALALVATCAGVIVLGIESGVVLGVVLSMGNLIWRASRPHIAVLGRIPGSEHFRNVERYAAETIPSLLMLRIDANLFFGNVEAVNVHIEDKLAAHPQARHLVLVMTSVSSIDTSAMYGLLELNEALRQRGIGMHLAEVKGPVMDRIVGSELAARLNGQVFLSAAKAVETLARSDDDIHI